MTFLLLFQWSRYGKIQITRPLLIYNALPFLTAFLFSRGLYSVSYFCSHFIVDLLFQCTIFSNSIQWQIGILIACSTHRNNKGKKCHLKVICTSLLLWIYYSISYFYPGDSIFLFLWSECIKMISKGNGTFTLGFNGLFMGEQLSGWPYTFTCFAPQGLFKTCCDFCFGCVCVMSALWLLIKKLHSSVFWCCFGWNILYFNLQSFPLHDVAFD